MSSDSDSTPPRATSPAPLAHGNGNGNGLADDTYYSQKQEPLAEWDNFDACSIPGNARRMTSNHRRKRRKDDSLFGSLRSWIVQHQIGMLWMRHSHDQGQITISTVH